jgi:hypothetical protein
VLVKAWYLKRQKETKIDSVPEGERLPGNVKEADRVQIMHLSFPAARNFDFPKEAREGH